MRNKLTLLFLFCLTIPFGLLAQGPIKPHASPEARQKAKDRADYGTFRRKIAETKEYTEERKKIPALQKELKETVKVYPNIDSVDVEDTLKALTMTGYIVQQIGENTSNAYELTYDRATKKIVTIKFTGESTDPEALAQKTRPAPRKLEEKKEATPKQKKSADDEDADEEEDEKEEKEEKEEKAPVKTKEKAPAKTKTKEKDKEKDE